MTLRIDIPRAGDAAPARRSWRLCLHEAGHLLAHHGGGVAVVFADSGVCIPGREHPDGDHHVGTPAAFSAMVAPEAERLAALYPPPSERPAALAERPDCAELVGRLRAGMAAARSDDVTIFRWERSWGRQYADRRARALRRAAAGFVDRRAREIVNLAGVLWIRGIVTLEPRFGPAFGSEAQARRELTAEGRRAGAERQSVMSTAGALSRLAQEAQQQARQTFVEAVWQGKTSADLFKLAGAAGMTPEAGDAMIGKIESLRPLLAVADLLPQAQKADADAIADAKRVVDDNRKQIDLLAGDIVDALAVVGRTGQELRRVRDAVTELAGHLRAGLLPIDFAPLSVLAWDATERPRLAKERGQQERLRDAQVAVERARRKADEAREAEKFVSALNAPADPAPIAPAAQDFTADEKSAVEKLKAALAPTA